MRGEVCAVVGGAFGSEGKGVVVYELRDDYDVHVRVGGPNAGHTLRHQGETWKMRGVPCGWTNPEAKLVIGAGAMVDPGLLVAEVNCLEAAGFNVRDRLYVDSKASVISWEHQLFEGGTEGEAHRLIGSTGEGVGAARLAKMSRGTIKKAPFDVFSQAKGDPWLADHEIEVTDTVPLLHGWLESRQSLLLEGTQGSGLSLTHGEWPFVTSSDTNAAQLAADAGLPPQFVTKVILVCRTYPIRVAGNSGPLHSETSWEEVGVAPERTTVTHKVRRVGEWDEALFRRSLLLNAPTDVALMFMDYVYPSIVGLAWEEANEKEALEEWLRDFEDEYDVRVSFVGVGGEDFNVLRVPALRRRDLSVEGHR